LGHPFVWHYFDTHTADLDVSKHACLQKNMT
jgi:hypothetical protein